MKNTILLVAFICLFFQKIEAQSNFIKGYILTSERDTLYGLIDNKDFYKNAQYCDFKKTNDDSVVRYLPNEIYGYRFLDGKFYVTRNLEIDNKRVCIFMEYLVHGKLDIYFFQDKDNSNHFFASKDTLPITELKYSNEIIDVDGRIMYKESKSYIGPLSYYTYDCPAMKDDIPEINEPDRVRLIHFARKYHNLTCKDESCIIYEKKLPRKIKLNMTGGTAFNFSNNPFDLKNAVSPIYGFNLLFQQSHRSEGLYLGIGLYRIKEFEGIFITGYQVPISINYINIKRGISPVVSYEFDLNCGFIVQALKFGLNYQMKKISFLLTADLKTYFFVIPYGSSINAGVNIDL